VVVGVPVKLPRMFRKRNASGKHVGSWRARVNGDEVNLGTSDGEEATKRLLQAVRHGKRNFVDELDEAADALDQAGDPPQDPPAAAPAAAAAPTGITPDAVIPPARRLLEAPPASSDADAAAEAEATNAAAAEAADEATQDEAAAAAAAVGDIPPEFLDQLLENGALLLVDLQLGLQAAVIKKGLKVQPGPVPPETPARAMAAKAWVSQLKIWFPSTVAMPPWAWALLLPATCAVQQIATSTPLPKEGEEEGQPPAESGETTAAAA
jgi:hypothetical protein